MHRLLAHLFEHQAHHRGQAHAMLSGTAVAPPQLDEFFCSGPGDTARRAVDFRALGFSEAAIRGELGTGAESSAATGAQSSAATSAE